MISDVIGLIGVGLSMLPYIFAQFGYGGATSKSYAVTNILGASLIIYSLMFDWNLAAFIYEAIWIGICLVALTMAYRRD